MKLPAKPAVPVGEQHLLDFPVQPVGFEACPDRGKYAFQVVGADDGDFRVEDVFEQFRLVAFDLLSDVGVVHPSVDKDVGQGGPDFVQLAGSW